MPEAELMDQLTKALGPVGGFLAFLAILVLGYLLRREKVNDNGGREETRENIRVIRKAVGRTENRMDRHLEQHASQPAD